MIRKETDRPLPGSRRPLLMTFIGDNRHMLNEIRDSLSHLRRNEADGQGDLGNLQLKHELSQSTPNLLDKTSTGSKMTRRDNQHHKALAEIRDSLRPYQTTCNGGAGGSTGGSSSDTSSSASSTSSQAAGDMESKVRKIMEYGLNEDIATRALQLSGNRGVKEALCLLVYLMEEKLGGKPAGFPGLYLHQSISPGPSSPVTSETNSGRSDSPLNPYQPHLTTGGLQPPPPLPPRAPVAGQPSKPGQGPNSHHSIGLADQENHMVPQGHVQQMIKLMSPGQAYYHIPPKEVMRSNIPAGGPALETAQPSSAFIAPQHSHSALMPQHSPSPLMSQHSQSALMPQHSPSPLMSQHSPSPLMPPHSQSALMLQHSQSTVMKVGCHRTASPNSIPTVVPSFPSSSPANTSASSAASLMPSCLDNIEPQGPPPPYSQARLQVAAVAGLNTGANILPSAPRDRERQQDLRGVPPIAEVPALQVNNKSNQAIQRKMVTSAAVPATRTAMGLHVPIIMPSVRSKEVTKPLPQTATAPLAPPTHVLQHGVLPQNLLDQGHVKGQVENVSAFSFSSHLKQHPQTYANDFLASGPHSQQTGLTSGQAKYRPEQLTAVTSEQSSFPSSQQSYLIQNHIQALKLHNTFYHQTSPDTSTQRSDSPVSRTTSQSPMSVMSSTSSPSTYSDVPEKPPPPYPRRGMVGIPTSYMQQVTPPLLPPRVPLKDKPPPAHLFEPEDQGLPPLPPHSTSSPLSTCSSSCPSPLSTNSSFVPCSLQDGTISLQPIDSGNNLSLHTANCIHSNLQQPSPSETDEANPETSEVFNSKHRCLSPLPERKSEARERDRLRCDTKVKVYSPQAFKFYMEQHVENVLKSHSQRLDRRLQLEKEMAKVRLSDEAAQQMRKMLHQKESNYIRLKRAKMEVSMFEKIQTLGVGAFGEVALVRKKDVGSLYAMKTLKKSNVIKRNQVAHVKAERDILAEADNEWVVKLYYSFQDSQHLYFVMDYVPGGDLMGLLIRKEILEEHLAQFYVAELVLAIESVHKMGFIHRDIKPDNILIDRDGHIKLTDFGLCTGFRWTHNSKYYQKEGSHIRQDSMEAGSTLDDPFGEVLKPLEQRRQREQKRYLAHSLVGTPNYIAPEVLLRLGYTKACDWWSVGVILYEMVIGQPPFYAPTPAETQYKVIHWQETLNMRHCTNISASTRDLILQLLQGADTRLGRNGASEVKGHPFFAGIHFQGLRSKPAPLKPTIKYLTDTSNFDPVDPDKLKTSDLDGTKKLNSKLENGKHPEHAFFEFTFRRFFDDGGHPCHQQDPESTFPVFV